MRLQVGNVFIFIVGSMEDHVRIVASRLSGGEVM